MSQGVDYEVGRDIDWSVAHRFGRRVVEAIRQHAGQGHWYNVNFPFCAPEDVAAIRAVPMQRFTRSPVQYYPSDTPGKFFIAVPHTPTPSDPANDFFQLLHGRAITVTPVSLQASDLAFARTLDAQLRL
jgi:5'-nucleotidase